MRAIVTGGAGFISSNMIRYLLHETPHDVVTMDALTYAGNLANLADVAGHGQAVSATAAALRNLLRKHMNTLDQSVLLQEMNEVFCREDDREKVQYATAAVFSNVRKTRDLIFTNAGHPSASISAASKEPKERPFPAAA